jgi:hypothetical protein
MNHSNFNFFDAFDFDDDTPVFAFQVATAVVAEEESNNQGRRTGYRGSILGHKIRECKRSAHSMSSNFIVYIHVN